MQIGYSEDTLRMNARIESDDASDIQLCNACEDHEFFCI